MHGDDNTSTCLAPALVSPFGFFVLSLPVYDIWHKTATCYLVKLRSILQVVLYSLQNHI